jgi:hypothetical protein
MAPKNPPYERPHVLVMVETSIAYGRGILRGHGFDVEGK